MIKLVALIWDFDGVIVFTPHERAWRIAAQRYGISGFTSEFYRRYVSGRPRLEGARNILQLLGGYSGRELEQLVGEFAELKNQIFNELAENGEIEVNRGALDFILRTREVEPAFRHILASASRNAPKLSSRLSHRGRPLLSFFDVDVSGSGASKREVFERAVKAAEGADCIVAIDDAPSGVRAAVELGIIALGYGDKELTEYGAKAVIESFDSLTPGVIVELCQSR